MPWQIFRVVFDCNIFIQALLNPDSVAAKCVDLVKNRQVLLFVSKATIDEVRDVVLCPNILSRLPDAAAEQIESFVEDILNISTFLKSVQKSFTLNATRKTKL